MIIDYSRLERKFQNGRYFEMYPERRSNMEQVLWDSLESGTFVRNNKKIGRNGKGYSFGRRTQKAVI